MSIEKITVIDEVKHEFNDSIDVGVKFESDYFYKIIVRLPNDFVDEMLQKKPNYFKTETPRIAVK